MSQELRENMQMLEHSELRTHFMLELDYKIGKMKRERDRLEEYAEQGSYRCISSNRDSPARILKSYRKAVFRNNIGISNPTDSRHIAGVRLEYSIVQVYRK